MESSESKWDPSRRAMTVTRQPCGAPTPPSRLRVRLAGLGPHSESGSRDSAHTPIPARGTRLAGLGPQSESGSRDSAHTPRLTGLGPQSESGSRDSAHTRRLGRNGGPRAPGRAASARFSLDRLSAAQVGVRPRSLRKGRSRVPGGECDAAEAIAVAEFRAVSV